MLFNLDEGAASPELGSPEGVDAVADDPLGVERPTARPDERHEDRTRSLAAGSYRFALLSGWQPEYATALLDDAAGGTPQRFLWFAAEDPTIPDVRPAWRPTPLWEPWLELARPLTVADPIADEVRARHLARTRGTVSVDPLDSHRDLAGCGSPPSSPSSTGAPT